MAVPLFVVTALPQPKGPADPTFDTIPLLLSVDFPNGRRADIYGTWRGGPKYRAELLEMLRRAVHGLPGTSSY